MAKVNWNILREKLMGAARAEVPRNEVPHAFEKRIMHQIRSNPLVESFSIWTQTLWKGAIGSLAVLVVCSFVSFHDQDSRNMGAFNDLNEDLEETVLASIYQNLEEIW